MHALTQRAKSLAWFVILIAIALFCAVVTTYYFENYPAFAAGGRDPPLYGAWALALGFLLTLCPLVWGSALVAPAQVTFTILSVHAALYSVLLVITGLTDSPGHSSPGDALAAGIWSILVVVLVAEAAVAATVIARMKKISSETKGLPFVYLGLTTAVLGGWFVGVLIWSATLPQLVVGAAETAAADRPYCIDLESGPARAAGDLTGINMRARNDNGWIWHFHALLVIEDVADRSYMNWSYRTGRFEPVSESAREGLHLDRDVKCAPAAHLAHDWVS